MTQEIGRSETTPPGMNLGEIVLVLEKMGRRPRRLRGYVPADYLSNLEGVAHLDGHAWVDVSATRDRQSLRVTGCLGGRVGLECGRCLQPFFLDLDVASDREFVAGAEPSSKGGEWEVQDEVVYLEDGIFSLRRMVEEELILALPMTRLCREGCAGLCTQCGADRNMGMCGCQPLGPDNPFAVLKNLGSFNP
ncbi:MAG: DUF177 domain-containing protein [Magnetococcales bacterium]|nr:DUF177 domain-containing protein [Magnetococcales bacterium]